MNPGSPDLNPIVLVKRKVSELKPISYRDLIDDIKIVWCHYITVDFCLSLVQSMPDQIEALIATKGGPTRY